MAGPLDVGGQARRFRTTGGPARRKKVTTPAGTTRASAQPSASAFPAQARRKVAGPPAPDAPPARASFPTLPEVPASPEPITPTIVPKRFQRPSPEPQIPERGAKMHLFWQPGMANYTPDMFAKDKDILDIMRDSGQITNAQYRGRVLTLKGRVAQPEAPQAPSQGAPANAGPAPIAAARVAVGGGKGGAKAPARTTTGSTVGTSSSTTTSGPITDTTAADIQALYDPAYRRLNQLSEAEIARRARTADDMARFNQFLLDTQSGLTAARQQAAQSYAQQGQQATQQLQSGIDTSNNALATQTAGGNDELAAKMGVNAVLLREAAQRRTDDQMMRNSVLDQDAQRLGQERDAAMRAGMATDLQRQAYQDAAQRRLGLDDKEFELRQQQAQDLLSARGRAAQLGSQERIAQAQVGQDRAALDALMERASMTDKTNRRGQDVQAMIANARNDLQAQVASGRMTADAANRELKARIAELQSLTRIRTTGTQAGVKLRAQRQEAQRKADNFMGALLKAGKQPTGAVGGINAVLLAVDRLASRFPSIGQDGAMAILRTYYGEGNRWKDPRVVDRVARNFREK